MDLLEEMAYDECRAHLEEESVGRVALCTPNGPQIVPVNYIVDSDAIVFRTAPYTVLGTHGRGAQLAFEVDRLDHDTRTGWSVIAVGRGAVVDNPVDVARYRTHEGPQPWAAGTRHLHLRLTWGSLTGRRVGRWATSDDSRTPVG
jgi:uncharacterized protein